MPLVRNGRPRSWIRTAPERPAEGRSGTRRRRRSQFTVRAVTCGTSGSVAETRWSVRTTGTGAPAPFPVTARGRGRATSGPMA